MTAGKGRPGRGSCDSPGEAWPLLLFRAPSAHLRHSRCGTGGPHRQPFACSRGKKPSFKQRFSARWATGAPGTRSDRCFPGCCWNVRPKFFRMTWADLPAKVLREQKPAGHPVSPTTAGAPRGRAGGSAAGRTRQEAPGSDLLPTDVCCVVADPGTH